MGWFWADSVETNVPRCPVTSKPAQNGATCPVNHGSSASAAPAPAETPAVCPVNHGKDLNDRFINPANNMPYTISSNKAPGQKIDLPTERTFSSIPRGASEDEGVWEYPSPQQMLNAMLKKGKGDVPEDAVESMVDVHNWLNEAAWREILEWEKPHSQESSKEPRLLKFIGRPQELSPRAKFYLTMSSVLPDRFNENPPFDRHDWTILRFAANGDQQKVRYVIDYYGGPDDDDTGMPTFYLDVRPALDSVGNAMDRFRKWKADVAEPVVSKALGKEQ